MTAVIDGTKGITAAGIFTNSTFTDTYTGGVVVDYSTGIGRISVGTSEGITMYNGGVANTSLVSWDSSGNQTLKAGAVIKNSSGRTILNQTGGVLQVVQSVKTDTFSTSSTTPVDITGLSVSITPSSTSSKILVMVDIKGWTQNSMGGGVQILRNGSSIYIGDSAGSRIRVSAGGLYASTSPTNYFGTGVAIYLDSPASSSSVTYKLQCYCNSNATYINRQAADTDGNDTPRSASSITVMEIAG